MLRGFGALYIVGGVIGARHAWFWARLSPDIDRMTRILQSFDAADETSVAEENLVQEDRGRQWWLLSGCIVLIFTGLAMLLAHVAAVYLLSATIIHQLCYFARQRRRVRTAPNPVSAEDARVEKSTIHGFFAALGLAVLAAWLHWQGALAIAPFAH